MGTVTVTIEVDDRQGRNFQEAELAVDPVPNRLAPVHALRY